MSETSKSPFPEEVRITIRLRHYSIRTEFCYLDWVKHFILSFPR